MESKTRAKLRALASKIEPSVIIGKEGITDNLVNQISTDLDAHELVKISVLESDLNYKDMLNEIASKLNAEPICCIGKKLVIYRYSSKKKVKHVLDNWVCFKKLDKVKLLKYLTYFCKRI